MKAKVKRLGTILLIVAIIAAVAAVLGIYFDVMALAVVAFVVAIMTVAIRLAVIYNDDTRQKKKR